MKPQSYKGQKFSRGFSEPRRNRGRRSGAFLAFGRSDSWINLLPRGKARTVISAVTLVLIVAVTLTIGQISGDDHAPSWSGLFAGSQRETFVDAGSMEVHAIDVGQGDCVLVRSAGANILIDAGENGMGESVVDYLEKQGVTSLDYVVCTHPHSDHIGGMDVVIASIKTGGVLMPELPESIIPTTATYDDLITTIAQCGLDITYAKAGDEYTFSDMNMTVVYAGSGSDKDGYNDYSIVLRFTCGEMSFLSGGDISEKTERIIMDNGSLIQSKLYKSSHHGSADSNCDAFLDAVMPEYAFICCGENNDYGHPHDILIKRYNERGLSYLRTDINGNIVYTWDGSKLSVSSER